jgi:propanediol dehydratase small subunit
VTDFDPNTEYPIGTRRPDLIRTPSGFALEDLTLDALRAGAIPEDEFRATAATLHMQAQVARNAERDQLADNLDRAAELAGIPDEVILDVYSALRPRRSSAEDLERWAQRLETTYAATKTAAIVREAAVAYAQQGLFS